jgi:hypothetical protein
MADYPVGATPALQLQAATPVAGTALVNGTPTIVSWTAPNDGRLHRFALFGGLSVSSTQTGGLVNLTFTAPDGSAQNLNVFAGALTAAYWEINSVYQCMSLIQAGATVGIVQTAQTAGASKLYAEIWGA